MLSPRETQSYQEHGYVVVHDLLDPVLLKSAQEALKELVEGARGLTKGTELYDLEPDHAPDAPRVRRLMQPHLHHSIFDAIPRAPEMLGALQQLLGPTVRLQYSKLNIKAPHGGAAIEWHQDWAFFPHTNDDVLTVGVMLDDCTLENGPLLVVPGSHRGCIYDHHANGVFCGAVDPTGISDLLDCAVPLTAPAGSVTFHHVRLLHGSAQNMSSLPRPLLLYTCKAGDAWPLSGVSDLPAFDAQLLSGEATIEPRLTPVPVRIPLPRLAPKISIYETQAKAKNRYFTV